MHVSSNRINLSGIAPSRAHPIYFFARLVVFLIAGIAISILDISSAQASTYSDCRISGPNANCVWPSITGLGWRAPSATDPGKVVIFSSPDDAFSYELQDYINSNKSSPSPGILCDAKLLSKNLNYQSGPDFVVAEYDIQKFVYLPEENGEFGCYNDGLDGRYGFYIWGLATFSCPPTYDQVETPNGGVIYNNIVYPFACITSTPTPNKDKLGGDPGDGDGIGITDVSPPPLPLISTADNLGTDGQKEKCPANNSPVVGEPINSASGRKFEYHTDYFPSGYSPLRMIRYYDSGINGIASLGHNWRSFYDRKMEIISSNEIKANRPDGKKLDFKLVDGQWKSGPDIVIRLYTYVDDSGQTQG